MESAVASQPKDEPGLLSDGRYSHDENNLAEFPLVLLSKRAPEGKDTIEYEDWDQHPHTGVPVLRKVTITGAGKFGLPTIHDEDVMMGLIYLTMNATPSDGLGDSDSDSNRTFGFARPKVFKLLGWPDNGEYYQRFKQSLRRWKGVTIFYENWWDPVAQEYVTDEGFNLLDNYKFWDGRRKDSSQLSLPLDDAPPPRLLCSITWNKKIFNSFKSGYLTTLDLDKFLSLPTAAAKRAYRYLNLRLPATGPQIFDLEAFAYQHVGYTKYKPARLRSKVQETIVEPLEEHDFIESMPSSRRFLKENGKDRIVFARKAVAGQLPSPSEPIIPPSTSPPVSPLLAELKRRGLGGKAATEFIATHPAEYLEQKINYLDFELGNKSVPSPGGYLRKAIEEDWGPPADYLPREERERQQRAAQEVQRQSEQQAQEKHHARRQQREQETCERALRHKVDVYLKQLDPAARMAIEAEALAAASPKDREGYESDIMAKFRDTLMLGMIRNYLDGKPELELITTEA